MLETRSDTFSQIIMMKRSIYMYVPLESTIDFHFFVLNSFSEEILNLGQILTVMMRIF